MNKNVLDMINDMTMELSAMSTLTLLLVRNHGDLTEEQLENMIYYITENLQRIHKLSIKTRDEVDELLMFIKQQ